MKNLSLFFLLLTVTASTFAQTKAKPKTKNVATQTKVVALKTLADSVSYAIGQDVAQSISKDIKSLNKQVFIDAIKSTLNGDSIKFSEEESRALLTKFARMEEEKAAKVVIDKGVAFLAKNKTNPKVKTTASGLQYEVIKEGTGAKPTLADTVVCHYSGMLIDSTKFDSSYDRDEPFSFAVGNRVIKGWTEGVQLMSAGSKYRLYIPHELGYGLRSAGTIPPGSVLVFDIELLEVKKGNTQQ